MSAAAAFATRRDARGQAVPERPPSPTSSIAEGGRETRERFLVSEPRERRTHRRQAGKEVRNRARQELAPQRAGDVQDWSMPAIHRSPPRQLRVVARKEIGGVIAKFFELAAFRVVV